MTDITIPTAALEAGARAAARNVEEGHSGVEAYKMLGFEDRETFIDAAWPNYVDQTRAAFLAMIEEWPDWVEVHHPLEGRHALILPITEKPSE